ncbi:MAG: hypothetical protein QOJ99_4835 [Bryobacterales bacterium]|nr:hypothetical protein [Bryobacterales bacterium]
MATSESQREQHSLTPNTARRIWERIRKEKSVTSVSERCGCVAGRSRSVSPQLRSYILRTAEEFDLAGETLASGEVYQDPIKPSRKSCGILRPD